MPPPGVRSNAFKRRNRSSGGLENGLPGGGINVRPSPVTLNEEGLFLVLLCD